MIVARSNKKSRPDISCHSIFHLKKMLTWSRAHGMMRAWQTSSLSPKLPGPVFILK
jgi:hypothetical protein